MNKFSEIKFRPMLLEDLPQVLFIENMRDDLPWPEDVFHDCIKMGCECVVLESKNIPIAYAIMLFVQDEARVLNICVVTEEQNKGYGRYIMQRLLALARTKKASKVVLKARESKQLLHKFYHQLGFRIVEHLPDYYDVREGKETALVLELKLNYSKFKSIRKNLKT